GGSTGKIAIEALHVCPPLIGALAGIRRAAPQVALATATRDGPPLRSYDSPNRSLFHRKPRARAASRSPQDGASAGFAGNWREFGFGAFGRVLPVDHFRHFEQQVAGCIGGNRVGEPFVHPIKCADAVLLTKLELRLAIDIGHKIIAAEPSAF